MADKKKALAVHEEAKATDAASGATERQRANAAIVAQTPYLSALEKVRLKMGECFQVLLVEPLAKHIHNAIDSTLDYAVRDSPGRTFRHCSRARNHGDAARRARSLWAE